MGEREASSASKPAERDERSSFVEKERTRFLPKLFSKQSVLSAWPFARYTVEYGTGENSYVGQFYRTVTVCILRYMTYFV